MIYYVLLICLPFVSICQSIAQKQYTLKEKQPNVILFSAITAFIALCFFILTSGFDLTFDARLIPYSLVFAAGYCASWIGTVYAVRYGSMALTSLITSFSLILPTGYGILLGEEVTVKLILGVLLLLSAIVLVNLKLNRKDKLSMKWIMFVALSFAGNGTCSIVQNLEKRAMGEAFTHEFMIIGLAAAFVFLIAFACFKGGKTVVKELKVCLPYGAGNGLSNAMVHFLMMTLIGNIPNTIMYPTSSALGMMVAFLLAFVVYKERFTKPQYAGYVLGVISLILLNI